MSEPKPLNRLSIKTKQGPKKPEICKALLFTFKGTDEGAAVAMKLLRKMIRKMNEREA